MRNNQGERFADWWGDNVFMPIAVVAFSLLGLVLAGALLAFIGFVLLSLWRWIHG